jgi:hypothetical protein
VLSAERMKAAAEAAGGDSAPATMVDVDVGSGLVAWAQRSKCATTIDEVRRALVLSGECGWGGVGWVGWGLGWGWVEGGVGLGGVGWGVVGGWVG